MLERLKEAEVHPSLRESEARSPLTDSSNHGDEPNTLAPRIERRRRGLSSSSVLELIEAGDIRVKDTLHHSTP